MQEFEYIARLAVMAQLAALAAGTVVVPAYMLLSRHLNVAVRASFGSHCLKAIFLIGLLAIAFAHVSMLDGAEVVSRAPPEGTLTIVHGVGATDVFLGVMAIAWLLGVVILLLRTAAGWAAIRRMKRRPIAHEVALQFATLVESACVERIALVEADVESPFVAGIRNPTIHLPVAFVTIPPDRREAILLHEIAHVLRRDLVAELVERLMLALLWINPSARVLRTSVRGEREIACDRLAVKMGASRAALARSILEMTPSPPLGSQAGLGASGAVERRVRALAGDEAHRDGATCAYIPSILVAVAATWSLNSSIFDPDVGLYDSFLGSPFGPMVAIEARDRAGKFTLTIDEGVIVKASVGGQQVNVADIKQSAGRATIQDPFGREPLEVAVSRAGRIIWNGRDARDD